MMLGFVWFFAGCASTKQNQTSPSSPAPKPVTGAFELELEPPRGGTILVIENAKYAPLPRAEALKKRYGAKELKLKSMVYIYPDGDEMWIQTASTWGAFQSRTYWTVITRPMPAIDLAEIDFSSPEGQKKIKLHNERVLAMEQGRFAQKEYGTQTGDGYVPALVSLLQGAGIVYAANKVSGGDVDVQNDNLNLNVNKPSATATATGPKAGP